MNYFQFDEEWKNVRAMEMKDRSFAHEVAKKAHMISDSEDSSCGDDSKGSCDLFDSSGEQFRL